MKNGARYYSHRLTQIEKGALIYSLNRLSDSVAENQAPNTSGVANTLSSLLQAQSSLVVDENGEPLAVWHGSPSDFNEFSLRYLGTNGTAEGYGFYFTDRRAVAESYARGTEAQRHQGANGRLFEVFLNIAKPLSNERVTMTREEFRRFLRELSRQTDADGNPLELLSNYGDAAYEGENAVMREAERLEYDGNDNDVDIVHSIINAVGDKETVFRVLRSTTGFDGIVADNPKWGGDQTVYVAFAPTQIKSATENVGTFDAGNPDIRYSLGGGGAECRTFWKRRSCACASQRLREARQRVREYASHEHRGAGAVRRPRRGAGRKRAGVHRGCARANRQGGRRESGGASGD